MQGVPLLILANKQDLPDAASEKDISEIADAAEVDENTLSSLVTLKHRDIVDLLKRS